MPVEAAKLSRARARTRKLFFIGTSGTSIRRPPPGNRGDSSVDHRTTVV